MKPIKYRVLQANLLSKVDKVYVASQVAALNTGPEGGALAHRWLPPGLVTRPGEVAASTQWQYEVLDRLGRVGVLKFRGAEVALFFKRQIQEFEPLPIDPIPEGVINDPQDAWQRFDLFGLSGRQVSARVGKTNRDLESEIKLLHLENEAKQKLVDLVETQNLKLTQQIEKQTQEIAKLKAKVRSEKKAAA